MSARRELKGGSSEIQVHGTDPFPGAAAGKTVVFTGQVKTADLLTHLLSVGAVVAMGYVAVQALFFGAPVVGHVYLVVASVAALGIVVRLNSPWKVRVGKAEVIEWRWNGRRTLSMRDAVASSYGRRHHSLVVGREEARLKNLGDAQLATLEWLGSVDGSRYQDTEALRAGSTEVPPMALFGVSDVVVPVDGDIWQRELSGRRTTWRLRPDVLRSAAEGVDIVLVPRTWKGKHGYFDYSKDAVLLATSNDDVETLSARIESLGG